MKFGVHISKTSEDIAITKRNEGKGALDYTEIRFS
jgi:hypothetical protein